MSNYNLQVRDKKMGLVFQAHAMDDYYGRHRYGYEVDGIVYNEDEFHEKFEQITD